MASMPMYLQLFDALTQVRRVEDVRGGGGDKVSKLVFYPQSASVVISGLGLKLKSKCIY